MAGAAQESVQGLQEGLAPAAAAAPLDAQPPADRGYAALMTSPTGGPLSAVISSLTEPALRQTAS